MSHPAAALLGLSPELLRTWPEVKELYARVVDNAYSHPDDRETAHNVLLRLIASATDMFLKGDPQLIKTASMIKSGGKNEECESQENTDNQIPESTNSDDLASQLHQIGQMDISGMMSGMMTGPSLNSDELQQMFSFLTPEMLGINVSPTAANPEGDDEEDARLREERNRERTKQSEMLHRELQYDNDFFEE